MATNMTEDNPYPYMKHAVVFNSQGDGQIFEMLLSIISSTTFLSNPSWLDILRQLKYITAAIKYFTTLKC